MKKQSRLGREMIDGLKQLLEYKQQELDVICIDRAILEEIYGMIYTCGYGSPNCFH